MEVNGLDPTTINMLLYGRIPALAAEIAGDAGVMLAFAAGVDDPLRRADIVGEALQPLRYFAGRFGRRSRICDRVVAELAEAGDGSRDAPDAKTLKQHARALDAHARTLDGLAGRCQEDSGRCRGPAESPDGQAEGANGEDDGDDGRGETRSHFVRNTYTVSVTKYLSFAGDDHGYFATVVRHKTGYGFGSDSSSDLLVAPAPTAWASAEEEAVAKAIRASAKEQSIDALADTPAEADRLRVEIVESIPEPPASPSRARERALAITQLAACHRVRPQDETPAGRSLALCLEHPDSICQWVAVTGLGAGEVRVRADFSDVATAFEFLSTLTDGEHAAIQIGRDEAEELPIEIVDLDYARAFKCHYGLRWIAGEAPAA